MKTIVKYSQYFTITDINFAKLIYQLQGFNKDLVTYTMALEQKGKWRSKEVVSKVDKILYVIESENPESPKSKDVIRYPISLLDKLLNYLEVNNLKHDIKIIDKRPILGKDIIIEADTARTPRDYQKVYIDHILKWGKHNILINLLMGYGKGQCTTTPIKTLYGWTPIGSLKVNDEVIGRNGLPTNVTGVYPQGTLPMYMFTFSDGRQVEADLDHLWTVHSSTFVNRNSKTIYKYRNYIISPYILGLMLGSRSISPNIQLDKITDDLVIEASKHISKDFYIDVDDTTLIIKHVKPSIHKHEFNRRLGMLKLTDVNIEDIFIPNRYLSGLAIQRYELLKGLIYTSNISKKPDEIVIEVPNKRFATGVYSLVLGLDSICYMDRDINNKTYTLTIPISDLKSPERCHMFKLRDLTSKRSRMSSRVLTTAELIPRIKSQKKDVINFIDLVEPMDKPDLEFEIHPYVLGVLIGDGYMVNRTIANVSDHVKNRVDKFLPEGYIAKRRSKNVFSISLKDRYIKPLIKMKPALKRLGLSTCRAWEKFIPTEYLEGSLEQRYELLRGLMDTDGEVSKGGHIVYSTTSEQLAKDVQLLARSLGGMCKIATRYTYYTYLGVKKRGRLSYRMDMRMPKPRLCVTLPKRLERLEETNQYSDTLKLGITSIEYSRDAESVCISVDNEDKLYVVQDYIVTHNTFIAMYSIAQLKKRFAIVVLPRFMDKWIGDVLELTNITRDEICVVKGLTSLIDIVEHPENYDSFKTFIFSLTTINLFIKSYLTNDLVASLGLSPEMIMDSIKVDIVLNDETHKEFYNVYKLMLFTNVRLMIALTATLENKADKHVENMYQIGFPEENRIANLVKDDKYINVINVQYQFRSPKYIKHKSQFGYNQPMFEQSIMKNHSVLIGYLNMIYSVSKSLYFNRRSGKQKLLIFAGTVKMCKLIAGFIKDKHPELNVSSYTQEDDYSILEDTDVICTTPISAGEAIDFTGLITTLATTSSAAEARTLQMVGRLRDLKIEGTPMIYANLFASNIQSHNNHTRKRKQILYRLAKTSKTIMYKHPI